MKLYIIRHGQTDWNLEKKIQGVTDIELNSMGIEQAEQARENIKDLKIDVIICSPLKRTKKTAEIINKDINVEIIYDDSFIERNCGDFEGKVLDDTELYKSQKLFNIKLNINENNVEPVKNVITRVFNKLDEIKNIYKDKNVLIVTHGGVARAINAYFNGIPEDGIITSANIKNCEIKEYEYK